MSEPEPTGKKLSPAMRVLSAVAVALMAALVVWLVVELFSVLSHGVARWGRGRESIVHFASNPLGFLAAIALHIVAIIGTAALVLMGVKETVTGRSQTRLGK